MKEAPQSNTNLERTRQIVDLASQRVEQLADSHLGTIVKKQWNLAKNEFDLPIYTYLQTLMESGVNETVLVNLINLLVDLRIDVSDPYASSSELSVIVGFMSQDLLGTDLSSFRIDVDKVKIRETKIRRTIEGPTQTLVHKDDSLKTYEDLVRLREWERKYILSDNHYETISRQILSSNNEALRLLTTEQLPEIWKGLNIYPNSKSVIYYRDLKTYAGDVDLYYWGPEKDRVGIELSRYLMTLGYKVDRLNLLIDSIIRDKTGMDNSYLGAYLYMYFFMGKSIEFHGDFFEDRYKKDILPAVSLKYIWPSVYKSIIHGSYIMEKCYSEKSNSYPGFKDLPFRLITATLMGLSIKYNVPYTLDFEDFLIKLGKHLDNSEIEMIRKSVYYINQIRNLYQVITQRRWEMISPQVLKEVNKLINQQGGDDIEKTMQVSALNLRQLCVRHLGDQTTSNKIGDFVQDRAKADPIVKEVYTKVTNRYKILFRS